MSRSIKRSKRQIRDEEHIVAVLSFCEVPPQAHKDVGHAACGQLRLQTCTMALHTQSIIPTTTIIRGTIVMVK